MAASEVPLRDQTVGMPGYGYLRLGASMTSLEGAAQDMGENFWVAENACDWH